MLNSTNIAKCTADLLDLCSQNWEGTIEVLAFKASDISKVYYKSKLARKKFVLKVRMYSNVQDLKEALAEIAKVIE